MPPSARAIGRDVEGRHNRARDVGAAEGVGTDRHERGRIRELQARDFGDVEDAKPDMPDLGRDHACP
eukprot:scaffold102780_cov57-Phaeocystis_antarctica.AAC.4